jgi:hypothetical protein
MTFNKRVLLLTALAGLTMSTAVGLEAQNRKNFSIVSDDGGHVALGLAIRKLSVAGTFMQAPAHPDDETNALFATFGYVMGLRVIDVQNNRGDGGQNEIGPELFRDIGVLRTAELLAAHQIDGAEQYFTRAIDYGYSFSPDEVIQKWGREEIIGDYVRFFRSLRPDIVVTMNIQGGGGDRAHEATTVLVREAYAASGDPAKYPEQLREGLRPWKPYKLYFAGQGIGRGGGRGGPGGGAPAAAAPGVHVDRVDLSMYDPLLGRTCQEISADARSNHKCQGTSSLPPLPGIAAGGRGGPGGGPGGGRGGPGAPAGAGAGGPAAAGSPYTLVDTAISGAMEKPESTLFDGIDITLGGLAKYAGTTPPAALTSGLAAISAAAQQAKQLFDSGNDAGTAAPIEAGLTALRALRANLASMGLSDAARYEIDFRLKNKEQDYESAVIAAHGLTFNVIANDGLVIGGQPISVSLGAVNRGATDLTIDASIVGFDGAAACTPGTIKKDGVFSCTSTATVPKSAKITDPYFTDTYWKNPSGPARYTFDPSVPFGVPFAPTPFRAIFKIKAGAVEVTRDVPVEYRYVKDLYFGDKRMELNVVPAFSVRVTPALAIVPLASAPTAKPVEREIFISVTNGTKAAAQATVALTAPAGWKVTPASAPIAFEKEDEAISARFLVTAPVGAKIGEYALKAVVTSAATGADQFSNGYQEIEYPHIQRRQVIKPAETSVKVIDVKIAPNLKVGYVMGVGDLVPPAIEQLGAKVTLIDTNELAWGDLSKYDVIFTGVRAYERRDDLRAYNRRLLDYVNAGGTMIVNYNKTEFNQAQYGPYPAQIGGLQGISGRVNDETVPVKILDAEDAVFNYPNKIGPSVWDDWTQERGQYFLGRKDPKYIDLVSMTDSFPDNPGEQLGGLVEAKYGKGRWIYLGLGLWRQLPAGTVGAYQLMANLLSLPKAPAPRVAK